MKIGTRVKAVDHVISWHKKGEMGTVVGFQEKCTDELPVKVKWDKRDDFFSDEYCGLDEIKVVKTEKKLLLTVQFIPRTRKGVKYFQIKITKQGKVFNHQYNSKQGAKKSWESLVNDIKNDNFIVK